MRERIPQSDALPALLEFKREIARLKEAERTEKKTAHFMKTSFSPELNENNLTEEDKGIYDKLKNRTLTLDGFYLYRNAVKSEADKEGNIDRQIFVAFIANKMVGIEELDS